MRSFTISGQFVDIQQREVYPACISVNEGKIVAVTKMENAPMQYILPGFIDAHVHIESSMLLPTAFARLASIHGTVATVSDPHEIANVCGIDGVAYMIANSKQTNFKFFFGAPSCVPATFFETAGAVLDSTAVAGLLNNPDIWYLSEMMNYPGVLFNDAEVMAKIAAAKAVNKPIDGHAPGLKGEDATKYAAAGISTDHECFTLDEALHKIHAGMHIIIREGSAAKNFEALHELLNLHPGNVMFCSDDKHPDELVKGHINQLVARAVKKGYDVFDVLSAACINPVKHYKIPVGLLKEGDPADFIITEDLINFNILQTYINGELVAEKGETMLPAVSVAPVNNFNVAHKTAGDFELRASKRGGHIRVIDAIEGQLITGEFHTIAKIENGCIVSDTEHDVLKIAVVNRYNDAPVAVAFIKNFGLKRGAIASTVAHDCHNIIVVGADDNSITAAVNALIDAKGGIAVADSTDTAVMPLPVAGLMSTGDGYDVARQYSAIDQKAKSLGTMLKAPFMTLSFMALLVIPDLKLSDKGLFSGQKFDFIPLEM